MNGEQIACRIDHWGVLNCLDHVDKLNGTYVVKVRDCRALSLECFECKNCS